MLKGKSAIITGAGRGIGRAIAVAFAQNGADLVITGRNMDSLISLKKEILKYSTGCEIVQGDISEDETGKKLASVCMESFGRIDALVNNAGINSRIPFLELTKEQWKEMLAVNLDSVFYCCQAVLPYMIAQGSGSIINMSSTAGKTAHANASISYGVSKAGINSMTQKLAYEMGPHHIRVNGICPGPVLTDMSKQWTEEYRAGVVKKIPLGELGTPENIADVAVFLASEKSGFITGETINVNGGSYMN